ncbi:MAG: hypothetical protein K0R31_1808 [Clostridiales bacterium]|jgi:ABC-type glutathione transport system ATPase component|nr:hypothetical protein [Clostridiales bacterium]
MKSITIHKLTYINQVSLFDYWRIIDSIENFSASFEQGTINGIIGELGYGGWLLSSLLGGKIQDECISRSISLNHVPASLEKLQKISCYVGEGVAEAPFRRLKSYPRKIKRKLLGIQTVKEHIQNGLVGSNSKETLSEIAEMFDLTGIYNNTESNGRINRPLEFQSGEVWRASMAIGMAYGKELFCFPWLEPQFINYVLSKENRKYIELIKRRGGTVIIPVSNEKHLQGVADQITYLMRSFL